MIESRNPTCQHSRVTYLRADISPLLQCVPSFVESVAKRRTEVEKGEKYARKCEKAEAEPLARRKGGRGKGAKGSLAN